MQETVKFGGTWKFFEKETIYQGELYINYDKRIILLELLLPANEEKPFPRPPYKGKIPYICGTLFSGSKILLYDCSTGKEHTHVMSYTQQIIHVNFAFWGLNVKSLDEIKFSKAEFDFGNIISWSGLCYYEWEFSDKGGSNLIWIHKDPVTFELNENLKITFVPTQGKLNGARHEEEIKANQFISVEFVYKIPIEWEKVMEDVLCIQYLIGLGVNQKVEINRAKYYHSSIYTKLSVNDSNLERLFQPVDVIWGNGNLIKTEKTERYFCLYTLDDIINNNSFTKWIENYPSLKPILDLYFTAFTKNTGSSEMLFLNLMQALETYHARFVTDDAKVYFNRVYSLVDSFCKGNSNQKYLTNFLLDKGQKRNKNKIYLRSRIADLIFADGHSPFWPRVYRHEEYIQKLIDTRNYYTHYNPVKFEKAFTKSELPWVNSHLLALIEYHLLVLVGFDIGKIRKKTVQRISHIDDLVNIHEHINEIKDF